jgi:hypothetical protein
MASTQMKKEKKDSKHSLKVTESLSENLTEKLKEFKTWAQVKSPKPIQPALSYALDWLVPELLGTGFRLFEISDSQLKAHIPATKKNLDSQFEIHQGLVTNALFELTKTFVHRQMPNRFFQIVGSEVTISKKNKWSEDLQLVLKNSTSDLDDFFVDLQKFKKAEILFEIQIEVATTAHEKFKKNDSAQLKLIIETTDLIA